MNRIFRGLVAGGAVAGLLVLGACGGGDPTDDLVDGGPPVAATPAVTVGSGETAGPGGTAEPDPGNTPERTPADGAGESPSGTSPTSSEPKQAPDDPPVAVITLGNDEEHRISSTGVVALHCEGLADIKVTAAAVVTVTGTCDDIEVDATGAALTLEAADDLSLDGDSNTVTAGSLRTLDIEGNSNVVDAEEILSEIDLSGDNNTVTFGSGSPQTDQEGSGNVID